jgi:hypothetical protein
MQHIIRHEELVAIVRRLRSAREAGATMFQLTKLMRREYGLSFNESQIWTMLTDMVSSPEAFASRDPGRLHKYGEAGRRAGRKKATWYRYMVAERKARAHDPWADC